MKDKIDIKKEILEGIPNYLPELKKFNNDINRAPIRKQILNKEEKKLSIKNALRYFPQKFHSELAQEFLEELNKYGRIYMFRFNPTQYLMSLDDKQQTMTKNNISDTL